jgi:anthranilate/para-aminobenzoate synthase component II
MVHLTQTKLDNFPSQVAVLGVCGGHVMTSGVGKDVGRMDEEVKSCA